MTTKVLADFHHEDLFYSLQLLFEKRLGWELYRPIGLDWYTENFWCVFPHPATAEQFLGLSQGKEQLLDGEGIPVPEQDCVNKQYTIKDGVYFVESPTKPGVIQRAITLEGFKASQFDVVISSVPQHIPLYNRLVSLYQPQAKHIFQVGNAWGHLNGVQNVLASTAPFGVPPGVNICFYHQEFDTSLFYPESNICNTVNSYVHFMQRKDLMNAVASYFPSWTFRSYGAGMEDSIAQTSLLAKTMRESKWTWHYKPEGDGYGHILHNSFACGKPVVIDTRHYSGKLGSSLLEHGKTCIDIGKCQDHPQVIAAAIEILEDKYEEISLATRKRFVETVNFDYEFTSILKPFFERLI
jgi:hypothetical protein